MDQVYAKEYSLHSGIERNPPLVSAAKRVPFDGRPMVVVGKNILGGFSAYFHSIRENTPVPCIGYPGQDDPLAIAAYVIESIGQEALLLDREHEVYEALYRKVYSAIHGKNTGVDMPRHVYRCYQPIYDTVKNSALARDDAIAFVTKFKYGRQIELFSMMTDLGIDISTGVRSLLETGALPEQPTRVVELTPIDVQAGQSISGGASGQESPEGKDDDLDQIKCLDEIEDRYHKTLDLQYFTRARLLQIADPLCSHENTSFRKFHVERLGVKAKSHVSLLRKMLRLTPRLLKAIESNQFTYKKLQTLVEKTTEDALKVLDERGVMTRVSGDPVTVEMLRDCKLADLERLIFPFMKPQHRARFVAMFETGPVERAKHEFGHTLNKLMRIINNIPSNQRIEYTQQAKMELDKAELEAMS